MSKLKTIKATPEPDFLNEEVKTGDYFFSKSYKSGYEIVSKKWTQDTFFMYEVKKDGMKENIFMPEEMHRINCINLGFVKMEKPHKIECRKRLF